MEQRNRIQVGDQVEIFGPDRDFFPQSIQSMLDEEGNEIQKAPHAQQLVRIPMDQPVKASYLIRKAR